jgi:hypothetical protein
MSASPRKAAEILRCRDWRLRARGVTLVPARSRPALLLRELSPWAVGIGRTVADTAEPRGETTVTKKGPPEIS